VSYPIIGLTGLLHLVTVMDKFRPQAVAEKGCVCRPLSSPPAHRAQRAHPVVDAAARPESPTSPVAAQPAAGAPAERRSRAGGGAGGGRRARGLQQGRGGGEWYTKNMPPGHGERFAVVYVRQSTMQQVLEHQESPRLHYGLVRRAVAWGWPEARVLVIDDDLGRSGTSAEGRQGFQRLGAEVGLDHVGLILWLAMSRL